MNEFRKRQAGFPRKDQRIIKQKLQKKRDHVDKIYECGKSTLRRCVSKNGEEIEGWRTTGDVGKAAKNIFPVVKDEFDPFIIMESVSYPPNG